MTNTTHTQVDKRGGTEADETAAAAAAAAAAAEKVEAESLSLPEGSYRGSCEGCVVSSTVTTSSKDLSLNSAVFREP